MFARLLILSACLLLALPMTSRAQVPTAEQLELLRDMSPEDRQALMEQLGLGSSGSKDDSTSKTTRTERSRDARNPDDLDSDPGDAAFFRLNPKERPLKPDDSVLVEIGFRKDKPPRLESAGPNFPPITIPGEPAPILDPVVREELSQAMELIRLHNPYQLDKDGQILLPGFAPIVLAGLNEEQATLRAGAIPAFQQIDIKVRRLPVRKSGIAGLRPFGYDLFKDPKASFAPGKDVPVPASYVVGPGDQLVVQLYGSQNRTLRLVVGRDGRVNFPQIGPMAVAGKSFDRVTSDIEASVSRQMIGVRSSVSMGDARSIQVFVMGEASRPGSYTVSGLATITSALYAAGGVKEIGSLRDIQLKRQGALVRRFDLYDLLLRGDTSDDAKLLPGDVIFIPPVKATIAIDGEVHRPGIYEINDNATVSDLIALAGGLTSEADPSRSALVRINEQQDRVVLNVMMDGSGARRQEVRNGDSLRILRLRPTIHEGVTLEGHVFAPGPIAWHENMRLTEAIRSVDELKPNADIGYVLIRRELPPARRISMISADLGAALSDPKSAANVLLQPRDRIMVFDSESGRRQLIDPILAEMRLQSRIEAPTELVRIDGRVKVTGEYPLEPGMRVSDLLRAGGGLQDSAFGSKAELTRYRIDGDARQTQLVEIDLAAIVRGDPAADLRLLPFDYLNIKEIPEWSVQETITIKGEVRFPGVYPIHRGETLHSVLNRAGGLSSLAFTPGAVFTRIELQQREQEQLSRLADRLQSDLAAAALQASAANQTQAGQALVVGQQLLAQLKTTKGVGRLVLDLDSIVEAKTGSSVDVVLRDGDLLVIPKQRQEVTVIGEVQTTTSHFYDKRLSRDDYIGLSGGFTRKADRRHIYVVRANGSVISNEGSGWFRRSGQVAIKPGDTIVAPLDTERIPALPLWGAVTQIIYNLAIAAAAVNSF